MGIYTTVDRIESELQVLIDSETNPNTAEVEDIIEEVEAEMDAMLLGRYHMVSGLIDVLPVEGLNEDTIEWYEYISQYSYSPSIGRLVIPDLVPIISVDASGCHTRDTGLGTAPTWTLVQEGLANEFLILRKKTKTGQNLGFALYFFQDAPTAGLSMLRLSYYYGWAIDLRILRKYATLKSAIEVLRMKQGASEPTGLSQFRGGDFQTFVSSNYDERIEAMKAEIERIEEDYLPEETGLAVGFI